jgi:3-phenylpropionate/trans-cinnamate dioxygenase ferredoxin reductase component
VPVTVGRATSVVVAGAGLAGLQTVAALRAEGFTGAVTLVGEEPHRPYDRPPLSKAVLLGRAGDSTLDADWAALDVDLRLGVRATAVEPGMLVTSAGRLRYDRLVIATGSLPVRPAAFDGVRYLRTVEDALGLRAALTPGTRVVLVGAGWIGAEVATAAARAGCEVTVVEAGPAPLAAALPASVGRCTLPWYAEAGIRLLTGAGVHAATPGRVRLADGTVLRADVVLAGVGVRPATGWLAGSPVTRDPRGAVLVDAALRSSVPEVYAVGDCAAWSSGRYGARLHVEHWDNALRAPAVAAANLLGGDATYDPVPYFWSDQFGRTIQVAGRLGPGAGEPAVWRGDPRSDPGWSACWLGGERLAALVCVDRPHDLMQGRRAIEQATDLDLRLLADHDVPIRQAGRAAGGRRR